MIDLALSLVEWVCEIKVTLVFLVIPYKNAFKEILERYFLAKLDAIASPVHLKIMYHDTEENHTVINAILEEEKCIREINCKDIIFLWLMHTNMKLGSSWMVN